MVRSSYPGVEHPIGYVEVQSSWLADSKTTDEIRDTVRELIAKTLREQPHLRHISSRMEHAADGAGRGRANLYLGFEPRLIQSDPTPPLDPRNLNAAPLPQAGWPEPTDGILPLGSKEQQFGRGT